MKPSIESARERLRAADPASDVPSSSAVELGEALNAVRSLTLQAAPESAVELAARGLTSAGGARWARGPRVQIAFAVVAVVVVAGVAVGVAGHHHRGSAPQAAGTPSHTAPRSPRGPSSAVPGYVPGSTADPNYGPALAAARTALAGVPTLPQSQRRTSAPLSSLSQAAESVGPGNLIDRAAFWVAPGDVGSAVAYFKAHPPADTHPDGYGGSGSQQYLDYAGNGAHSGTHYSITVAAAPSGVAVRVDVLQIWYSTKPPAEYVGTVSSVDVVVDRDNSGGNGMPKVATVRRTLTGRAAQSLAAAVDAAQLEGPGAMARSCPIAFGYTDRLTFHSGARSIVVVANVGGCEGMQVTAGGVNQPPLIGSVNPQVLSALHLPANYGY